MVKEETFKGIYAQYFPKGAETTQYAHYVFNSFDHDNTGAITFTDFVIGLSVLARGSLQEKLRWAFSLYDINGDGYITKDELSKIVQSIYELMGKAVEPMIEDHTTRDHVERVFQPTNVSRFLDRLYNVRSSALRPFFEDIKPLISDTPFAGTRILPAKPFRFLWNTSSLSHINLFIGFKEAHSHPLRNYFLLNVPCKVILKQSSEMAKNSSHAVGRFRSYY
ncbi:Kv channel-interacting protein 4 [Araneus ventricosus]|uniref:Kv channel-interacting protein 4 n=1 Tax=Araneus ventricosus TaxID=182803 RepID=A0A4Y2BLA8_ARAVE|nr:Kv channel-interacting protein 4 [Araneus ventricosus]